MPLPTKSALLTLDFLKNVFQTHPKIANYLMKKKILIFSLAYYPKHIGGAEVAIKEITDRLSPEEFEFHVLCNRFDSTLPKEEKIGNVVVHRIGIATNNPSMGDLRKFPLHLNKILYQWTAYFAAKKLHKKYHFDGIWAMMAHATGVPAAKFKRRFKDVKYLLTLQEGDPPEYIEKKMRIFGSAFDDAFLTADAIQVISTFLGNWAKRKGFRNEPILIPNAVDTKHFTQEYQPQELQAVRLEYGVSSSDILLVTTSRLVHKNGIDDVIKALVLLPENIKFIIFGVGPDEPKLKTLIQDLQLQERVQLRGQIGHKDMPKHLKACDIFIRPSRSEGMGNSFVEAMAAELPVIATQEGGIADFLFDAIKNPEQAPTGFAVAVDSPKDIAVAVSRIIDSPDSTKVVIAQAKKMAISKYDWNLIAADMKEKVFVPLFK
jgi:glycosyltransferase involved in cell wall biosynthesis